MPCRIRTQRQTGRGSCGQARKRAAPLRSALTVTAPLFGRRDAETGREGRPWPAVFVIPKLLYDTGMSMGVIIVEQTGSPIRCHERKKRVRPTLVGLGLNGIGRVALLPNTPQTRGMIKRVSHLVRVVIDIKPLARRRFDALAGYARLSK
jgi:large subunit ribosomal protein L30